MLSLLFFGIIGKFLFFWEIFATTRFFILPSYVINCLNTSVMLFLATRFSERKWLRLLLLATPSLMLSFIMIANCVFFYYFNLPITLDMFPLIVNIIDIPDSVFSSLNVEFIILVMPDLLVFLLLLIPKTRGLLNWLDESFMDRVRTPILVAIVGVFSFLTIVNYSRHYTENWYKGMHPFVHFVMVNPVNYYASSIGMKLYRLVNPRTFSDAEKTALKALFETRNRARQPGKIPWVRDPAVKPNIIVLQVESLKKTVIGQRTSEGKAVAPNLERLAAEGIYCENFFSQARATCDSSFSFNTSLYSTREFPIVDFYSNHFNALPRILADKGWKTLVIDGARKDIWNDDQMNKAYGYSRFYSRNDFPQAPVIGLGVNDEFILAKVAELIKESPKPLLLLCPTLTSHHPFAFPGMPKLIRPFVGDEMVDAYFNAIHYADIHIGKLMENLKQTGVLENTIVLIYGDHSIRMEHYYNALRSSLKASEPVDESVLSFLDSRVPLIMYAPNLLKPGINQTYCGQIDLAPTILEMCGIARPAMLLGESLFSENRRNFVMNQNGVGILPEGIFWGVVPGNENFAQFRTMKDFQPAPVPDFLREVLRDYENSEKIVWFNLNFL